MKAPKKKPTKRVSKHGTKCAIHKSCKTFEIEEMLLEIFKQTPQP